MLICVLLGEELGDDGYFLADFWCLGTRCAFSMLAVPTPFTGFTFSPTTLRKVVYRVVVVGACVVLGPFLDKITSSQFHFGSINCALMTGLELTEWIIAANPIRISVDTTKGEYFILTSIVSIFLPLCIFLLALGFTSTKIKQVLRNGPAHCKTIVIKTNISLATMPQQLINYLWVTII